MTDSVRVSFLIDGAIDGVVEEGESGRGTVDAGAVIASGEGMDDACRNLISTPLRVPFNSESMDEVLEEPSFDCDKVSRSTLAYCTVYRHMSAHRTSLLFLAGIVAHLPVLPTSIDR